MLKFHKVLWALLLGLVVTESFAQTQLPPPTHVAFMSVHGQYNLPGANFADRFGASSMVGLGFHYKTSRNWIFGGEASYIFGSKVREDSILNFMKDDQGYLLGLDGGQYNPILYLRGYRLQLTAGKILPLLQYNENTGLLVQLGVGFIQHKIYYDVKQRDNLPQISRNNVKAFDRLSNGWALTQLASYHYMSVNRLLNFQVGIEVMEGLTFNRRSYNFPAGDYSQQRMDLMIGLKAAWILPFYTKRIVEYNREEP